MAILEDVLDDPTSYGVLRWPIERMMSADMPCCNSILFDESDVVEFMELYLPLVDTFRMITMQPLYGEPEAVVIAMLHPSDVRRLRYGLAYPSKGLLFLGFWGEWLDREQLSAMERLPPSDDWVMERIYFVPMALEEFRNHFAFFQLVGYDWRGYAPPEAEYVWEWQGFRP